ncbi:MAG: MraY family glycosyltransferase [Coraliomargarita sp.]
MLFPILFFLLLGCFSSWIVIHWLLSIGFAQGNTAQPQHHHTHAGVIPRIGGVGIVLGFAVTYLLAFFYLDFKDNQSLTHYMVFVGAALAFLMGFVDDLRPLGAKLKLLIQIGIGVLAWKCGLSIERFAIPFTGIQIELGILSFGLTVFWFVAIMNLINLIDGLDGLAGGIGLMLMLLLAYLGFAKGAPFTMILALGTVGAILGFLFHNFPPAKVYMGDSGAYMIGYVIAALALLNSEKGAVAAALIAPMLALALPIIDVAFALIRRGLKGLPLFRPDKEHIHHRLMRTGLSHRGTVLVLYSVSLFALIGGLLAFASQGRFLPIFLGFAFVVILFALRGQKISARSLKAIVDESMQMRADTKNALYLKDWFIAEVDRADTGEHLWSDFHFVLKKIGICRAVLTIGDEQRSFYVPGTAHDNSDLLWTETHNFPGEQPAILVISAEQANFSDRQFAIIADIAAEAWSKAAARWAELNGHALNFHSVAQEATNYREQKIRNLYRPTY